MKFIIIITLVVLGFGGLFLITQNHKDSTPPLTFAIVQSDVKNGGELIDVRTPEEYAAGHIDGAVNISLQSIQSGTMPQVSKDKPIYVYCHSGNRSSQATVILKKAGYTTINDLGAITHVQSLGGVIKT